jgi:cellulose synthase/poly-beta-1,6-N-acetylglucosamine synthase-like glycosyltransferase
MTVTLIVLMVAICMAYLIVTLAIYVAQAVVAGLESATRRHESGSEDYGTLAGSRFTLPVSVMVAAYNEESIIVETTQALLDLEYPELEVIVVNDGSTDGTFAVLQEAFALEPSPRFIRRRFVTEEIRGIYRSSRAPNLAVIDKANGGKADSWNVALNVARYRYVCGVDADTWFDRQALLKSMRLVLQDPARVIGVTSALSTARNPERALAAAPGRRSIDWSLLDMFQHLDFVRAFFNNRIAWSRHGFMLCSPGAFQIWRRDVLEEVGGYSRDFTCEDIEVTFRIHELFLRADRDYEILCLTDNIATTEGPDTVAKLVSQRERWQRVTNETVWHYRRMWFNPEYKTVGLIGTPFFLMTEVLAPVFELVAISTLVAAFALGLLDLMIFAVVSMAVAFTNAALTACAIHFDDLQSRLYRKRDLARVLLLSPLDFVLYRPIMLWARLKGSWGYLRGDKSWDRFERNVRAQA